MTTELTQRAAMIAHDFSQPCPVPLDTLVRVRCAGLETFAEGVASEFRWQHHLLPYVVPVVEYEVLPPKLVLDYSKITDVVVDGLYRWDHPDYVDAYISAAQYEGREMSEEELEVLNENANYINEMANLRAADG
jgi:hypothetical protein